MTAAPRAVAGLLPPPQQRQHSTTTGHRLSTSSASTAGPLTQTKQGSRGDWLGFPAGAAVFWQHARARPPAYKPGTHALLTPSAREAAAADAVADCAYAAAAMQTVQPDARVKLAKELAAAAVQAARTEVAVVGTATGQSPRSVPQEAWGGGLRSAAMQEPLIHQGHSPAQSCCNGQHRSTCQQPCWPQDTHPGQPCCMQLSWQVLKLGRTQCICSASSPPGQRLCGLCIQHCRARRIMAAGPDGAVQGPHWCWCGCRTSPAGSGAVPPPASCEQRRWMLGAAAGAACANEPPPGGCGLRLGSAHHPVLQHPR